MAVRRRIRSPLTSGWNALLLLLPTVALIALYKYAPIGQAIWASLNSYSVAGLPQAFVGIDNYARVVSDESFRHSLGLTGAFVVIKIPVQLALGIGAALLLSRTTLFNSILRVVVDRKSVV